jgi:Thioesterase-like superfamily
VSAEPLGGASPPARGDAAALETGAPGDSADGFFRADSGTLIPASFATSPWGPVLHGRLIGGLTARAAEQARAADPDLAVSRLTIDMFRTAALAPVTVSSREVRAGRRIAVLEVTVEQDGTAIGQGRALLLRRSEQPEGPFRPAPAWNAPTPAQLGPPEFAAALRWTPPWQSWRAGGAGSAMTDGVWIRETHPLITGEQLTPLVRLAMAADLASPVSNSSARGLSFINADYTVYLGREPEGEYIGIQPAAHISDRGVAAGQCVVHDAGGPAGFVTVAAVANRAMGSPGGNGSRG